MNVSILIVMCIFMHIIACRHHQSHVIATRANKQDSSVVSQINSTSADYLQDLPDKLLSQVSQFVGDDHNAASHVSKRLKVMVEVSHGNDKQLLAYCASDPGRIQQCVQLGAPRNYVDPLFLAKWAAKYARVDWMRSAIHFGLLQHRNAIYEFFRKSLEYATKKGLLKKLQSDLEQLHNLKLLLNRDDTEACRINIEFLAVLSNQCPIINHFITQRTQSNIDILVLDCAAFMGRSKLIDIFVERNPIVNRDHVVNMAALGGHLDIIRNLIQRLPQRPISISLLQNAAKGGHVHILQWFNDFRNRTITYVPPYDVRFQWSAASCGQLEALQWLRSSSIYQNSFDDDANLCSEAASNGHVKILEYLRDPRQQRNQRIVAWDNSVCTKAAIHGHLNVLKFLFDPLRHPNNHIAPCNEDMCRQAVFNDQRKIIKWLMKLKTKSPCTPQILMKWAASCKNTYVLNWLNSYTTSV